MHPHVEFDCVVMGPHVEFVTLQCVGGCVQSCAHMWSLGLIYMCSSHQYIQTHLHSRAEFVTL